MKIFSTLSLFGLLAFFLSGCGDSATNAKGSGEKPEAGKTKIAFVTNAADDFWVYAQAGVLDAQKKYDDIDVIFRVGDGTPVKQKQIVDDLLVSGIKSLSISPTNAIAQTISINKWSAKIPVICVDSDSPKSNRTTYLGTDNVAAGRKCGELLKEALPNGGDVMVFVGLKDAQNAVERFQGLKEAIAGTKINILDLRTDNVDRVKARKNAEDTITRYPNIAGMVGLWSYNAPAILKALKSAKKEGKVKVVSFDENPNTLLAIDEGLIHGTVVQNPYKFGFDSVELMRTLAVEKKSAKDAGVPENKIMVIDTKVIRKGEGKKYKEYCDSLKAKLNKKSS